MEELFNLEKLITIVVAAAIIIPILILRMKSIFKYYRQYTPEFFRQKQMEKGNEGYLEWLKKEYRYWSMVFSQEKDGRNRDKVKVLEQEMRSAERQFGVKIFDGNIKPSDQLQ